MGVSGCGKTSVAQAIAALLRERAVDAIVLDGDDYHAPESRRKMAAGLALDDADRWPWLDSLAAEVMRHVGPGAPDDRSRCVVLACSALRRAYRERLLPDAELRAHAVIVALHGSPAVIRDRMMHRTGHFMQPSLLDSQLATLELPLVAAAEPAQRILLLDVDALSAAQLAESVLRQLDAPPC